MLSAQGASTSARTDAEAEAWSRIGRPETNLVSWPRELPPGLEAQLLTWAKGARAEYEEIVVVSSFDPSVATSGLAEPARDWLTRDIGGLLARLAELAEARRLRVSLRAIRSDRCRKFHVDYLRYRLVTTYVGPGTQWLPDDAVRRTALDHPPDGRCATHEELAWDPAAVHHAMPGEVILMKGGLHPDTRGAVHRSPPIEGTGLIRVVLIASTVDGP